MTTTSRTTHTVLPEWLLVTGQPGSGKTTAVKKLVDFLQSHGKECRGFYTDEVLDPKTKSRIGFDVVTVPDGNRGVLSRKAGFGLKTNYKTGSYFVDVDSFEAIALPSIEKAVPRKRTRARKKQKLNDSKETTINSNNSNHNHEIDNHHEDDCILVLDEIGRMELHSTAFSDRVRDLLRHTPQAIRTGHTTTTNNNNNSNRLVGAITAPIYGHRVPFCDEVASRPGVEVHKLTKKTRDGVVQDLLHSIEARGWLEVEGKEN